MAKMNILSQLSPNFQILHVYAISPGQRRCRRVTWYDVPIFRFQSPGDILQPITSYAVADNYDKGCNKI